MSFVIALMLAMPASAGATSLVVKDKAGDLVGGWIDWETCETSTWPDGTPVAKVGYFDIESFWLTQKGKTYTFGMELAADLPKEGSALPYGFVKLKWLMWIEPEPWNMKLNNIMSLYTIQLVYDGSTYFAELKDYPTGVVIASLPFTIHGAMFELQFSAASIGDLESFWFMPCTVVQWSASAYWDLDTTDAGAVPGQAWWDIPWPPV